LPARQHRVRAHHCGAAGVDQAQELGRASGESREHIVSGELAHRATQRFLRSSTQLARSELLAILEGGDLQGHEATEKLAR